MKAYLIIAAVIIPLVLGLLATYLVTLFRKRSLGRVEAKSDSTDDYDL